MEQYSRIPLWFLEHIILQSSNATFLETSRKSSWDNPVLEQDIILKHIYDSQNPQLNMQPHSNPLVKASKVLKHWRSRTNQHSRIRLLFSESFELCPATVLLNPYCNLLVKLQRTSKSGVLEPSSVLKHVCDPENHRHVRDTWYTRALRQPHWNLLLKISRLERVVF